MTKDEIIKLAREAGGLPVLRMPTAVPTFCLNFCGGWATIRRSAKTPC